MLAVIYTFGISVVAAFLFAASLAVVTKLVEFGYPQPGARHRYRKGNRPAEERPNPPGSHLRHGPAGIVRRSDRRARALSFARAPLPAAVDRRGDGRLLHREG